MRLARSAPSVSSSAGGAREFPLEFGPATEEEEEGRMIFSGWIAHTRMYLS